MESESRDSSYCVVCCPKRHNGSNCQLIIATAAAITTACASPSAYWSYTVQFPDQRVGAFCSDTCSQCEPQCSERCVLYARNRNYDVIVAYSELRPITPLTNSIKSYNRRPLCGCHFISQCPGSLADCFKSRHDHNYPPSFHRSMWVFPSHACACRCLWPSCRPPRTADGHP